MARTKKLLAVILFGALVLRILAGAWWQSRLPAERRFAFADSESYWTLAQTIVKGEPFQLGDTRVFRTPGYPAVLAATFWVAGSDDPPVMWARATGALLGTLSVAGVWGLGRMLFDNTTGTLAAGMAAVFPEAIAPSVFVLSEAPFCPLMVAHLFCWTAAWRSEGRRVAWLWAGLGGLAAGGATLMRPSWLLFTPLVIGAAVVFSSQRWRHAQIGGAMLLGLALAMSPWWVRNYQVTGHFVLTTLQVGASLYDGLNPNANGGSDMRFVEEFMNEQRDFDEAHPDKLTGSFEERLDRRLGDASLAWARQHPGRVAELAGLKFFRIWNVWPNDSDLRSVWLRLVIAVGYVPLLVGGLWGAWRWGRRDGPFLLCILPAVYFTALHVVFVSSIRYRQPALLPMIVLAAGVVMQWHSRRSDDERSNIS